MGCTNSTKKPDGDVLGHKLNEGGFKNLFYATTEFDISASEDEHEDEILSVKSINNKIKQQLTKQIDELSSGLPTVDNNSSSSTTTTTTSSTLLDNRLKQTSV